MWRAPGRVLDAGVRKDQHLDTPMTSPLPAMMFQM
jgi:hypothetical protein